MENRGTSDRETAQGIIAKVRNYKNKRVVARYMADQEVNEEEALEAFNAFKQYIAVCGLIRGGVKVGSRPIDEMWHTFLLHTVDYAKFCEDHFGFFIHHQPTDEENRAEDYFSTRSQAERLFGELDTRFWPSGPPAGRRCISGHFCIPCKTMCVDMVEGAPPAA